MEQYFDIILKNSLFQDIGVEELRSMLGCLSAKTVQVA